MLFDSEPERVAAPVLIVANTADTCPASPPTDAPKIEAALTQAARKEILYLESTTTKGQPCDANRRTAISVSSRVPSSASRSGSRRRSNNLQAVSFRPRRRVGRQPVRRSEPPCAPRLCAPR